MVNDIKEKLRFELMVPITGEPQVVYILSRVRKILDIDHKGDGKYGILRFYCNWALHTEIEDTKAIKDLLQKIKLPPKSKEHLEALYDFGLFRSFDREFRLFLKEYGFITTIYKKKEETILFKKILRQIYSDTALIIKTIKKTKITLTSGDVENPYYSFGVNCTEE
ncbi:MAG: hypothetical protein AB1333_00225 [Patescibacteria group bacterium]